MTECWSGGCHNDTGCARHILPAPDNIAVIEVGPYICENMFGVDESEHISECRHRTRCEPSNCAR
jgi:hypothetical protein